MASKRPFSQEEEKEISGSLFLQPKRSRPCNQWYKEVTTLPFLESFVFHLEPVLRGVVREEVQKALNYAHPSPRPSILPIQEAVRFQLYFQNSLPCTLFTGEGIKTADEMPIQIAIKDANNEIVSSGPLSSLKIKIVVIRGDFNTDGRAKWSKEEFMGHVLSERRGKRPLLTGELDIRMHNGAGCIVDASFTDISSCTWSGKFRLGAVVSDTGHTIERVQEAVTEAFQVKDSRVKSSQKDRPPSLNDEVCQLKKIPKDGVFHKRLTDGNIYTVQDFLRAHVMDPGNLRGLLGRGMSHKWWAATLEHASQCALGNNLYSYRVPGEEIYLVFNSIFELLGVNINGRYHLVDELPVSLKDKVDCYRKLAYKNPGDIAELHGSQVENLPRPLAATAVASVSGTSFPCPAMFPGPSSSQAEFQHEAHASFNWISSDIPLSRFQPLHQSAAFQKAGSFRRSSDRCANLFVTGPSSSLMPNLQSAPHDEAAKEMSYLVVSSCEDVIPVQCSDHFASNNLTVNSNNVQNQGFQSHTRTNSEEQFSMFIAEIKQMLQSPPTETTISFAPSSPRKWVHLSAAFKFLSVIKRSTGGRAKIAHPGHQAVLMSV